VGHTADDQAETVLLNLLRGAGLDGLSGMRASGAGRRAVSRPIIDLRRAETSAFVAALGLAAVSDPSNSELRFRRNRVRLELLPLLADIAQRDPVPLLVRTARALAEDAELLDALASGLDATDTAALRAVPKPLAKRALRAWLRGEKARAPPSFGGRARSHLDGRGRGDDRLRARRRRRVSRSGAVSWSAPSSRLLRYSFGRTMTLTTDDPTSVP